MAKAKKLPSGNWRVLLYVGTDENGKRQYESITAATEAEANMLASRRRYDIERGINHERRPEELTVEEAIAKYIAEREELLSPKTIREYDSMMRNHFDGIKHTKLKKLTERAVKLELSREASALSAKSVQNIYGLLKSVLSEFAPELDLEIKTPKAEKTEMNIPSNDELLMIFSATENTQLELPILLAATCGLRRGEICAIDLEKDVDYERCKISVIKAVAENRENEWVVKGTKTKSSKRIIDCPDWVIDRLHEAKENGYKFPKPYIVTNNFARLKKEYGLKIRFHDLRHYYASLMLSLGVPDKYAMQRMGHSTPNMLKNVYQHVMEDKNREFTEQINEFFGGLQHEMQHKNHDTKENESKITENERKKEF